MDWITCNDCGEEYKVISDTLESVAFCPFCGTEIELEYDERDDEDEEDY